MRGMRNINIDIGTSSGPNAPSISMAQSMKQAYKSANNIFGNPNMSENPSGVEGTDDEKAKAKKVKIPFYMLNQEERIYVTRMQSAKQEKKREEELKQKKEELVSCLLFNLT